MTATQTIRSLATTIGLSKKIVFGVLDELHALAAKEAKRGFTVPGFGVLALNDRKARMGRNPRTGEPVKIAAKRVCKFRLKKALKDAVLAS